MNHADTMKPERDLTGQDRRRMGVVFFLILALLAVGITAGSIHYYRSYEREFRVEVERQLSGIAELKVGELTHWRQERLADAAIFFKNPSFSALVRRFFAQPADVDAQRQLQDWLGQYPTLKEYNQVRLMDAQGVSRMTVPADRPAPSSLILQHGREALQSGQVMFEDFYRSTLDQRPYLAILVPILDESDTNRTLGVLVLRLDPATYLYPFIQRWPTPSRTAETLLVRRDGNDALYLNELKFQTNTALRLRIPLGSTDVPAVKAVLGHTGIVEGVDYRGVRVIAALRTVPDSPWFLEARRDTEELYAPMWERLGLIAAMTVFLLFGTCATLGYIWRRQSAQFYRERFQAMKAIRESDERFRAIFEQSTIGKSLTAPDGRLLEVNRAFGDMLGYTIEEMQQLNFTTLTHPDDLPKSRESVRALLANEYASYRMEKRYVHKCGSIVWTDVSTMLLRDADGAPLHFITSITDITEHKLTEEYGEMAREILQILNEPDRLQDSIQRVIAALKARTGFDAVGIRLQDGDDFPYFAQQGFSKEFLLTENTLVERDKDGGVCRDKDGRVCLECTCGLVVSGKTDPANPYFTKGGSCWTNDDAAAPFHDTRLHPRDECLHQGYASVALVPIRTTDRIVGLIQINDRRKGCFTLDAVELLEGIASHIGSGLMRKRLELEMKQTEADLRRSNKELEQFAYVASHDLQEPLRKVASFTQLLAERYADKLDADAKEFMAYTVDGAHRMQGLINDLLAFSRVGTCGKPPALVDCESVFAHAADNLELTIKESGAEVTHERLPTVMGDAGQLVQLFQNLIGNAIKFHGAAPPHVHVSATRQEEEWVFRVRDNGIGIDPQHFDHLFLIFQRLHSRAAYPGTGIGLAISKRVVERHGGRIWVESEPRKGSSFYFSIPAG